MADGRLALPPASSLRDEFLSCRRSLGRLTAVDHRAIDSGAEQRCQHLRAPATSAVDIERLSVELGELAAAHTCPTCRRSPAQRFELLRALGARLQPGARDRLELLELASHLAWTR